MTKVYYWCSGNHLSFYIVNHWINCFGFFCAADVKQDMLETIIPKSECDSIMVVLGEHKGQVSTGSSSLHDAWVPICAAITRLIYICLFRSAVFSSGTRTSAKRWSNSTDTRRKCSRWTMTAFVTMSEKQITDSPHK